MGVMMRSQPWGPAGRLLLTRRAGANFGAAEALDESQRAKEIKERSLERSRKTADELAVPLDVSRTPMSL